MTKSVSIWVGFAVGVGVIAMVFLFLPLEHNESTVRSVGKTHGRILIDSPEVYTRERMVNDRFRQEAWLLQELERADSVPRVQGVFEVESSSRRSLNVTTTQSPTPPKQEKREDQHGGSGKGKDGQPEKLRSSEQPQLSAIEVFRSRQAYLEEVRNAIIENQLDDRHDLDGNTLYRLKFDATIIPGNDSSAWAEIKVQIRNDTATDLAELKALFTDWISDVTEEVNAPLRERFDQIKSPTPHLYNMAKDKLRIYAKEGHKHWSKEYSAANYKELMEALSKTVYGCDPHTCPQAIIAQEVLYDFNLTLHEDDQPLVKIEVEGREEPVRIKVEPYIEHLDIAQSLDKKQAGKNLRCEEETEFDEIVGMVKRPKRKPSHYPIIARNPLTGKDEPLSLWSCLDLSLYEKSEGVLEIYTVKGKKFLLVHLGFDRFRTSLKDHKPAVFTYAVTPKESTQQLSSSSQRSVAEQFRASAAAAVATRGVAADAEGANLASEYARFLDRRPIVVGIAGHTTRKTKNDTNVAEFGWLVGPKLIVGSNGLAMYRHQPSQNSLAALVSIPSWWQRADIQIETGWLDNDGNLIKDAEYGAVGINPAIPKTHYQIILPRDTEQITSLLLLHGKRPGPIIKSVNPLVMGGKEGPAILIAGQYLWRSAVVTIGSQRSKRIFVLPNMKGIIAEFGTDQLAAIRNQFDKPNELPKDALQVWTSEGVKSWGKPIKVIDEIS